MNPFVKQPHEYQRQYDIWETYIHDNATFLARMENISYEEAREFVASKVTVDGKNPKNDPEVLYLAKRTRGNREKYVGKFSEYLQEVVSDGLIMAPTMTVYTPVKDNPSLLGKYILDNMALRKVDKKKMHQAKIAGDKSAYAFYGVMQESRKIKNNSMSGAHASPSTCLYNKSSHSTLTSSCRCATSYGNANNERFLMGNRHLWNPELVIATLLTCINTSNFEAIQSVMVKYNLHFPSTDEVMECIKYSTTNYWRNEASLEEIREFVATMQPIEKAAYVYLGDLYHLNKYNKEFVHAFIIDMRTPATEPHPNPDEPLSKVDADITAMVSLICADIMAARELKTVKEEDPKGYALVGATADKIFTKMEHYADLIKALWRPDVLPASIYKFPAIYRKAVVTSDTDSSIFTNEYWVQELEGYRSFTPEGYNTSYLTTYLTSQVVKHYLAMLSANLGVEEDMIHKLSMKNEFYFPAFTLTAMAKHYYALVSAREGNVYDEMEIEVKGVNLRSSNAPESITKRLHKLMEEVLLRATKNEPYTAAEFTTIISDIEEKITSDIRAGGHEYLHCMEIKDADSYVDKEEAGAYQHHMMWETVFSPKYGTAGEPPYKSSKISVNLRNNSSIAKWIETIEDREFAERMSKYLKENGKSNITTFRLPEHILGLIGIPVELRDVIDIRKIVMGIMKPFYLVLESFGIYMLNKNNSRIISEELYAE